MDKFMDKFKRNLWTNLEENKKNDFFILNHLKFN